MVFTSVSEAREHFRGMGDRTGPALSDLIDQSTRVGEQSAQIYAPRRTGGLYDAISRTPAHDRSGIGIEGSVGVDPVDGEVTGSNDYPFFVNVGTGLYGPLMRMIRPKRAEAMVFVDRYHVITKSIQGQKPQPFMDDAYDDVVSYIEGGAIDLMIDEIVVG